MKKVLAIIFLGLLLFDTNYSIVFAEHANEKYCFDCMYKYKIGDKKNDTYKFEINLQNNDLSKKVDKQLKDKKNRLSKLYLI